MSYIFVGGAQRTGTTLVQLVLCQGAGVNPFIQEAGYLRRILEAYAEETHPARIRNYFDSLDDFREFHGAFVRRFLERTRLRLPGTTHLVLKEPTLTRYFPELHEFLGDDVRFVCMVRDPRDTICSILKVAERQVAAGEADPIPGDRVKTLCDYYRNFYLPILNDQHPELLKRILFVRYEDLVLAPEATIDALEHWFGLNLSKGRHNPQPDTGRIDFTSAFDRSSSWHSELYGKPISADRIGAYKTALAPRDIAVIENDLAAFFKLFKFETELQPT